jgi:concanavalin A-like lectin/glucanase superfamily protein
MSIETDIMGRGPVLYWPLDDATGPAAVDASGNGKHGVIGGSFTTHQYGPEPGTFALQLASGGFVTRTGMPMITSGQFSMCAYISRNHLATPTSGVEWIQGNDSGQRGWFLFANNAGQVQVKAWGAVGSGTMGLQTTPVWNKWWHAYTVTFQTVNIWTLWIDGTQMATVASNGVPNLANSGDTFGIMAPYPCVYAHVAYFDKLLTTADITAIHSHRFDWPFGPMIDTTWPEPPAGAGGDASLSPSDPVVVGINTDLSDIRRAVRWPVPPGPA